LSTVLQGVDVKSLEWKTLGLCSSLNPDWFSSYDGNYDSEGKKVVTYENDKVLAKQVDEICLSCPVMVRCYSEGENNKEFGVWGGIFWDGLGKRDIKHNKHKTDEVWERIEQRISS